MTHCRKCYKEARVTIDGMCSICWSQDLESYYHLPTPTTYNYKCPICKGEFNEPARDPVSTGSSGNPRCPFCSNQMGGLL